MVYTNYKEAAERHIEVCSQLLFILDSYKEKETANGLPINLQREKVKILSNLYYLSGYIIECSYYCAIYKHLNWTSNVTSLNTGSTPYNVSCFPTTDPANVFVIRRKGYNIKQHQLSGNMHFFQTIVPLATVSTIPLIDHDISTRSCFNLFDKWNAEIRYVISPSINLEYENVYDFFFLSVEIYEGLILNSLI